jgi:hypothetical protein
MLFGVKPTTIFALPLIGDGYHPDSWPRFRDCFVGDDEHPEYDDKIIIYTRTGGNNRETYEEGNEWIRSLPGFITDYDDSFDSTFACWVFEKPEEWLNDIELVLQGNFKDTSPEYKQRLRQVYPKLSEQFDKIFSLCDEK